MSGATAGCALRPCPLVSDEPLLCRLKTDVLAGLGLQVGSFILFDSTTAASPGDLVLVESDNRRFFGLFLPQPIGRTALFVLPGRAIAAADYIIVGIVHALDDWRL